MDAVRKHLGTQMLAPSMSFAGPLGNVPLPTTAEIDQIHTSPITFAAALPHIVSSPVPVRTDLPRSIARASDRIQGVAVSGSSEDDSIPPPGAPLPPEEMVERAFAIFGRLGDFVIKGMQRELQHVLSTHVNAAFGTSFEKKLLEMPPSFFEMLDKRFEAECSARFGLFDQYKDLPLPLLAYRSFRSHHIVHKKILANDDGGPEILYVNKSFQQFFGWSQESLTKEKTFVSGLVHVEDFPDAALQLAEPFTTQSNCRYFAVVPRTRFMKSNGEFATCVMRADIWCAECGLPVYVNLYLTPL
eukprot:TRINITY_DN106_c0_g2_i1.p1 TRINITY_DN106_c0_g2~~TRINITY_DN106_c0_g2_i1.p1  ORF type:complete len:301 (+),score=50.00 TRINITY_DN106_c0_g2_i1:165-1067(+)